MVIEPPDELAPAPMADPKGYKPLRAVVLGLTQLACIFPPLIFVDPACVKALLPIPAEPSYPTAVTLPLFIVILLSDPPIPGPP